MIYGDKWAVLYVTTINIKTIWTFQLIHRYHFILPDSW